MDGEQLYLFGGETEDGRTLASAVAYDLRFNEWRSLASLPEPVANAAAAVLNGQIFLAGGSTVSDTVAGPQVSNRFWRYEPDDDSWERLADLPYPLAGAALVAGPDAFFLLGGWDGEAVRDEVWRYAPSSESSTPGTGWELITRLETPRAFFGAVQVGDEIVVAGGFDGKRELDLAAAYNLGRGTWRALPPLSTPRGGLSLVFDGLAVFALGGGWTKAVDTHERFDPATGVWSNFPSPIQGEWRHMAAAGRDGRLHLVGGWSGAYLDTHLQYQSSFRALLPVISNE
jgi:hypothetical protein